MLTSKSPRDVMRVAYRLARECLPAYSCKFSRRDFTLPQLVACLAVKEHQKRSYRGAESLLADSPAWLADVGLTRAPDHNTLQRAASFLLRKCKVDRLLDTVARWAAKARLLGLSTKPLAVDSSMYESRHVSRHYERRQRQMARAKGTGKTAGKRGRSATRDRTVRGLPKLAVGVATHSHLVLSMWTGTGMGSDHPHFERVLFDAWRRVPNRSFASVQDAGYDSEAAHESARRDMGLRTLTPATIGRPRKDGGPPEGRWRRLMKRVLGTKAGRRRSGYTQRAQAETVNSMMKRNLGSALAGRSAWSRKRDLALKVFTHDVMVLD